MKPFVVAYYQSSPSTQRIETELVAKLATWCNHEGFTLGASYRDTEGPADGFESMISVLERGNDGVVGVVVPSWSHLEPRGPELVSRIEATGKRLLVTVTSP